MSISKMIVDYGNGTTKTVVNTEKLRAAIKEHGVDFIDEHCLGFLNYAYYMTQEHIDLIFMYRPDPFRRRITSKCYLISNFLHGNISNGVYILERFLEQDDRFLFVTMQICMYDYELERVKTSSMIDALYNSGHKLLIDESRRDRMATMLRNHEKKYYRLFDLLKHHIE